MCSSKYPCGACNNKVHDDEKAVQCENDCMLWFHAACIGTVMKNIVKCVSQKGARIAQDVEVICHNLTLLMQSF